MTELEKTLLNLLPEAEQNKIDWIEYIGRDIEVYYKDGTTAVLNPVIEITTNKEQPGGMLVELYHTNGTTGEWMCCDAIHGIIERYSMETARALEIEVQEAINDNRTAGAVTLGKTRFFWRFMLENMNQ